MGTHDGSPLKEQNFNRKGRNSGYFDLEGLHQLKRLTKAFDVKTSRVYALPVAYFAHLIDFRS